MANNEMSKEEWQRKDMLNSRMSAIKAVAMSYEGEAYTAKNLIEEANEIYNWVTQDQSWTNQTKENVVSDISHPMPTPSQDKALKKVEKELNMNPAQVWAFLKKEGLTTRGFPTEENVDKFINYVKSKES